MCNDKIKNFILREQKGYQFLREITHKKRRGMKNIHAHVNKSIHHILSYISHMENKEKKNFYLTHPIKLYTRTQLQT